MSATLLVPLLVCLIGLVVYLAAANPKAARLGELAYFAGLFVTLLVVAQHVVRIP